MCTETNKVDRVLPDGKVEYRKNCRVAGKVMVDSSKDPITIPKAAAAHLARSRYITWLQIGKIYMPQEVYADKSMKKLLQAGTLSFE